MRPVESEVEARRLGPLESISVTATRKLRRMYPRLVARARHSAAEGFATATIELPGSGDRPRWPAAEQAHAVLEEARQVTVPLHVLLQWDDEGNDRRTALDLFDAFGSEEKSLYADMGGHTASRSSRGTPRPSSSPDI